MKAIKEAILEGPDSNKVFRHDISLLHKKTYETCGTLVAWSILNGGPGLPVFNTDLFSLMTGGDIDVQDFTSVVDSDVRAIFLQVTIYSDQSANCLNTLFSIFLHMGQSSRCFYVFYK